MKISQIKSAGLAVLLPIILTVNSISADSLTVEDFKSPPKEYLPKTWMHAMNGNLSKPGFTQDFKAMKEAGIGGAIFFHVHRSNFPYSSRGPVRFGTDEFYDTLVHAAGEADKQDIEFGIHNSDGWSSSGGPWITPEMSMKRITWSELSSTGGKRISLPQPGFVKDYYRDIAVIAVPKNTFSQTNAFRHAKFSSSDPALDASVLADADWDTEFEFSGNSKKEYWVQVELKEPTTLRSLQIETPSREGEGALQISNDGVTFTTVVEKLRRPRTGARMWAYSPQLVSEKNDGYTAKYFRFVFDAPVILKRFDLWTVPRIDHWLSMNSMERGALTLTPHLPAEAHIKARDVVVLNRGEIPEKGITLPTGDWRILRFGYTSTGAVNIPATAEGEGLECDKMDAKALQFHFDQYVGKLVKKVTEKGYKSLKTTEIDSYEMGGQNWTQGIEQTFAEKFNYDFIPWLPLLTGQIIESSEHSGAILQDFRRHLSDLMVENYFGEFTRLTKKYGLESYIEPYGWGPFDELASGGKADRVMGEFWVRDQEYNGRVVAAISSGHIYGKKIISAESFTSINTVNWYGHPSFYKHYGDEMWARGINETMFHRYAHQPNTYVKPGMTMDSIGSHIDSTQTWWANSGVAWFKYLARGSYLLQQGVPHSDFLIHLGDVAPQDVGNGNNTKVPHGFNYDYVNTEVLIERVKVEDGWLVLPEGTRYRALELHNSKYLHINTLKRVHELVLQGAMVISKKPKAPIGYSEWAQKELFEKLTNELWGHGTEKLRQVGKGTISTLSLNDTITTLNYQPDLKLNGIPAKAFSHRRIGKNDLYFFYNDTAELSEFTVDIREGDGQPEIWDVAEGNLEKIEKFSREGKRLTTKILLEPFGSRFVMIRRDNLNPAYEGSYSRLVNAVYKQQGDTLMGSWSVEYDPQWAGPGVLHFEQLIDWIKHSDDRVKHYSGTAKYRKTFTLSSKDSRSKKPLYLDLGNVQHTAEVTINGKKFATLWRPPYAVDIRSAVKTGENLLEVNITNNWVNRLIGDEALPDTSGYSMTGNTVPWINENVAPPKSQRVTFTGYNFFAKEKSKVLQSSGLLGPVRLISHH